MCLCHTLLAEPKRRQPTLVSPDSTYPERKFKCHANFSGFCYFLLKTNNHVLVLLVNYYNAKYFEMTLHSFK